MEARQAVKNDKEKLKYLWSNSFHFTNTFIDWYFDKVFDAENTFITTERDKPISTFSIIPQTLNLSGCEVKAAYTAGVATLPEYRNDENTKQLLSDMLVASAQHGYVLSMLIPPSYRFYERYGWRTTYSYKQYDITPADLPEYRVRGSFERAEINDNTVFALNDIYGEFMRDKNAYALRDKNSWVLILEDLIENFDGKCFILRDEDNKAVGYILAIIRDKKMWIYEFAYKNRAAYESIVGFMYAHGLYVDKLAIKAAADDLSYLDFCDCREALTVCPFAAARIIDAKKALTIASTNLDEGFKLQIVDRLVEENNKTFMLSKEGVQITEEDADVVTDIGTLTQLFMGYISVAEACRMNLISGSSELLKRIFGKKSNYINMLLV